jgi:hypothetical protein
VDVHVSDPERSGEPDATLGGEEDLEVLELLAELTNATLRELLGVQLSGCSVDGVSRGERSLLGVVSVEKLEVLETEGRLVDLVELGDLVEDLERGGVLALREQELGGLVESEDGETEEENGCSRRKGSVSSL